MGKHTCLLSRCSIWALVPNNDQVSPTHPQRGCKHSPPALGDEAFPKHQARTQGIIPADESYLPRLIITPNVILPLNPETALAV